MVVGRQCVICYFREVAKSKVLSRCVCGRVLYGVMKGMELAPAPVVRKEDELVRMSWMGRSYMYATARHALDFTPG